MILYGSLRVSTESFYNQYYFIGLNILIKIDSSNPNHGNTGNGADESQKNSYKQFVRLDYKTSMVARQTNEY